MTPRLSTDMERLCLEVGPEGVISVPCTTLVQHQIDGIRFLFKQYRQQPTGNRRGVLLNYPAGCGKSVLVALFINAVIEQLDKPVLILYELDSEKRKWLEVFTKWTAINNDKIAVDPTNICVKKEIILKNIADASTYCSRTWSMLVVKSENFNKILLKWQLKVKFKIWITSVDVKKDLTMLRSIYTWINDTDTSFEQLFDTKLVFCGTKHEVPKDPLTNDILLHTFLEDFLLRRSDLKPFIIKTATSKKNKDATGKKIKRSKKNTNPSQLNIHTEIDTSGNNDHDTTSRYSKKIRRNTNENEEAKMDVESFIRENDPLERETIAIKNMEGTILYTKIGSSVQAGEISTDSCPNLSSAVHVCDDISRERVASEKYDVVFKGVEKTRDFEEIVFNPMDVYTPKIQSVYYVSRNDKNSINGVLKKVEEENCNDHRDKSGLDLNECLVNPERIEDDDEWTRSGDEEIQLGDESVQIKNEEVQDGYESPRNGDDSTQSTDEEIPGRYESIDIKEEGVQVRANTSIVGNGIQDEDDRVSGGESIRIKDEIIHSEDEECITTLDQGSKLEVTSVKTEIDSIFDSKMREIEERALKKFKGSFLDNIF